MSSRKLSRLKLEKYVIERLENEGIITCKDVLQLSKKELLNILNISHKNTDNLIKTICKSCCPSPRRAYDMYMEKSLSPNNGFLPTSLAPLDDILQGGLPIGSITEITGPPSVGKTQFCFLLSVLATLPPSRGGLGGGVVYVDTESAFSAQRLKEIAENRFPEIYGLEAELHRLMQSIVIHHATSTKALKEIMQRIECYIIKKKIKLVVIDSMASLLRKEFGSVELSSLMERNHILVQQAAVLKTIAERCQIVVFITNQITTQYTAADLDIDAQEGDETQLDNDAMGFSTDANTQVIPALGLTWSHCVNTRLVAQFLNSDCRQLVVVKSPLARNAAVHYTVRKTGIVLADSTIEEIEYADPEAYSIQTKCRFLKQESNVLSQFSL